MMLETIVLASGSPRRLELLRSINLHVVVEKSDYDEPDDASLTPRELGIRHARNKAHDVIARIGRAHVVVAADTVVDVDGIAYNKPRDADDAKRMLNDLSGRTHKVHTAVSFAVPDARELQHFCETSLVTFYPLAQNEIDAYVGSGEPMDKAGAYGIQGYGATLVERIEGDFYTVMGFPLARFVRALRSLGFVLPITKTESTEATATKKRRSG